MGRLCPPARVPTRRPERWAEARNTGLWPKDLLGAFAHPCIGLEESRGNSGLCHLSIFLDQFLGSTEAFLRPDRDLARAPRADAVKPGRRPPPEAARSGLDGVEHGASIAGSGDWSRPEPAT